jgi:hypothetical protein
MPLNCNRDPRKTVKMTPTSNSRNFLGKLSAAEIELLRNAARDGMPHPVAALALADGPNQVRVNTERAARAISHVDDPWLAAIKPRLVDSTDFTNASSALGELRAYGALLEAGLTITPDPTVAGKKVVPEFEVDAGDGPVIFEVHSRQLDRAQAQALATHHKAMNAAVRKARAENPGKVLTTMGAASVAPLGAPNQDKTGDSILTNAISRICSVKAGEHQSDPSKGFVLWLDLQDPTVWGLPISDAQLAPLWTEKDGEIGSGALWFALYGRKNDPMMEMRGCDYREIAMLHDGRFALTNRLSAVVYSLPSLTVLMEHPSPALPVPRRLRASLLRLPFFGLDRSVCSWKPGLVRSYLELQRETIAATANALVATNPA